MFVFCSLNCGVDIVKLQISYILKVKTEFICGECSVMVTRHIWDVASRFESDTFPQRYVLTFIV